MAKNTTFHKKPFDQGTKLKLEIFKKCFKEWLPVFINNPYITRLFVFDFFAGSGKDSEGTFGSPLILLEQSKIFCKNAKDKNKKIHFLFNELEQLKVKELKSNVNNFMEECSLTCGEKCLYDYDRFLDFEFKDLFNRNDIVDVLNNNDFAKFILLDQYGFKHIDEDVFKQLVNAPKTDFIFFVSSSYVKRFKDEAATKKYFDTKKNNFDEGNPKECHRQIAEYYKNLIPLNKEYYLHHFTIKKGANYWGLVFGTNHTLGMEKFLKVCWEEDNKSGEANFNIDNDVLKSSMFYEESKSIKKDKISKDIENKILSKELTDNISGLKFALKNGCLPKLFTETVKKLEKEKKLAEEVN